MVVRKPPYKKWWLDFQGECRIDVTDVTDPLYIDILFGV